MILSFHPIIVADENIICAGRDPDDGDLAAIRKSGAVILPQGCTEPLYRMATANCRHVFPNLDARFDFPSKSGQVRLIDKLGIAHPDTVYFESVAAFQRSAGTLVYPVVVKYDWGDQGDTVFKADDSRQLAAVLDKAAACESTGQCGLLVQEYVPADYGALRVVLIGTRKVAYWRVPQSPDTFGTHLDDGSRIDTTYGPDLRRAAITAVEQVGRQTGLQLAGFDFIFDQRDLSRGRIQPLMLEINYFFGRTGLGGSEAYYRILEAEIDTWLAAIGLSR
jgi:ribosomal protein S6--L-glutamate ligase